jgi:hypothetical protein
MSEVDRFQAAAESGLDRINDVALDPGPVEDAASGNGSAPVLGADDYGIHLDDPDADLLTDDLDAGLRDDGEADALDAFAERFNARDLEGLLEIVSPDTETPGLLGNDLANLPAAMQDLWSRRPTGCLTRGYVDTDHVGVLWEHDGKAWWRVAVVHVDDVDDERIGVLEFSDDDALLERVVCDGPDASDLEEGARWIEWEEGADGDD